MAQQRHNPFGPGGQLRTPSSERSSPGRRTTERSGGSARAEAAIGSTSRVGSSPFLRNDAAGKTPTRRPATDRKKRDGAIQNTITMLQGKSSDNNDLSDLPGTKDPGYHLATTQNIRTVYGKAKRIRVRNFVTLAMIQQKDEQDRVQKKVFTAWINMHLAEHADTPTPCNDLFEDVKSGLMLLQLLEVLSGETLKKEKGTRMKRLHYIANVTTALKFLESKRIKLVNINPSDVVAGKPAIVLGLVWTIILYFQIEDSAILIAKNGRVNSVSSLSSEEGTPSKKSKTTALDKFRMGAKKAMLLWAQKAVSKRFKIEVKDFGASWRDGKAFNAIIHTINPELVNMEEVSTRSNLDNLEGAFSVADEHLGIRRLLDPEDVDVDKPDEKSIMTYVTQFVKAFPDPDQPRSSSKLAETVELAVDEAQHEEGAVADLLTWLDRARDTLTVVDTPVTDLDREYQADDGSDDPSGQAQ